MVQISASIQVILTEVLYGFLYLLQGNARIVPQTGHDRSFQILPITSVILTLCGLNNDGIIKQEITKSNFTKLC
jgi:hypothetical protein